MTVVVPNALALAGIADGSSIVASDHRNNYAAVQVGVNGLIAMFSAATAKGDLLVATASGTFDRLPVGANGLAVIADSSQPLGMKYAAAGGTTYRKTTSKAVNTTVAATDLLNGEITIAAGAMGATGMIRLTAWGDWANNAAASAVVPRFQVTLGGTTVLDTGASTQTSQVATRFGWRLVVEIFNSSAAAQTANMSGTVSANVSSNGVNVFTTGEGSYTALPFTSTSSLVLFEGANSGLTVDTTTAKLLALNVINGNAGAAYETKLFDALVEVI